jgi:hypothetical protein
MRKYNVFMDGKGFDRNRSRAVGAEARMHWERT